MFCWSIVNVRLVQSRILERASNRNASAVQQAIYATTWNYQRLLIVHGRRSLETSVLVARKITSDRPVCWSQVGTNLQ